MDKDEDGPGDDDDLDFQDENDVDDGTDTTNNHVGMENDLPEGANKGPPPIIGNTPVYNSEMIRGKVVKNPEMQEESLKEGTLVWKMAGTIILTYPSTCPNLITLMQIITMARGWRMIF